MYNSQDLAISIKTLAKEKNIIIKDMLADCELGSNTMSALYHGKSIAFNSLAIIADYLNCSVDYLLGRASSDENNLLSEYRKLSIAGKAKVRQYINELSLNDIGSASKDLDFPDFMQFSHPSTAQVAAFGGDGVKTVHISDEDALDNIK